MIKNKRPRAQKVVHSATGIEVTVLRKNKPPMNDELEYIVSSYASLKLNNNPLKDVNVNSPAKLKPISPQKRPIIAADNPQEIYKLCMNSIDLVLRNLKYVKAITSSFLRLASSAFIQLYKIDDENFDKRKEVTKKHQMYILKLIELESKLQSDFSLVLAEINLATSFHKSRLDTEDDGNQVQSVLLGKAPISFKFLVLQVLFKKYQLSNFENEADILRFYAEDLQTLQELNQNQKLSLVKLALSFVKLSSSPIFKICLNLKFLQYLHRFGFEFKTFISNLSYETFSTDIAREIKRLDGEIGILPIFLHSNLLEDHNEYLSEAARHIKKLKTYPELNWSVIIPDEALSNNLVKLLSLPKVNNIFIKEELNNLGRPSDELYVKLGEHIDNSLLSPSEGLLEIVLYFLEYTDKIDRKTTKILDKFVMSSTKFLESPDLITKAFVKLRRIFLSNDQPKRLKNISNLSYNFGLKAKSPKFVKEFLISCIEIELILYGKSKNLKDLSIKFEKALKYLSSNKIPTEQIFKLVWNDEFIENLSQSELLQKLDIMDQFFGAIFSFHPLLPSHSFQLSEQNKAIIFVLCSKYGDSNTSLSEIYNTFKLTDAILEMLCATYYTELPFVKSNIPLGQPVIHSGSLIRSSYYLSLEIKTRSTSNISKILHLYKSSWLPKNRHGLTLFELHFLERMVDYLKFINFQKALNDLLQSLERYLAKDVNGFKEWYKITRIENFIALKNLKYVDITDLEVDRDLLDYKTPVEISIQQMENLLLKIKYALALGDEKLIDLVSGEMKCFLDENSSLLTSNSQKLLNKKQFDKVIKLLSKLHFQSAKMFKTFGSHMEAFISSKTCVQVAKSALKTDLENFELISILSSSFRLLISILIHLGLSKDADYFSQEFLKFNDSMMRYKSMYTQNCYFICYYYHTVGKYEELNSKRVTADRIFDTLCLYQGDEVVDNFKLVFLHYLAQIYDVTVDASLDTRQKLKTFFNYVEKDHKALSNSWKLHYEYHFNSNLVDLTINKSNNPYLHAMNYIINSKRLFNSAKRALEIDPVFSTLEDSAMSIPSTYQGGDLNESSQSFKLKSKTMRNTKKSVIDLKNSRDLILKLFSELKYLANYQVDEVHKTFALGLLTLSSILNGYNNESLDDLYNLGEFLKNNPFANDKYLIEATSRVPNLTPNFNLSDPKSLEAVSIAQTKIDTTLLSKIPDDWLVISLDICAFNGDLIISRITKNASYPCVLRLPLSRHSSRTVDEESFTFDDAMKELNSIIQQSNETTSKDRISSISTPEGRQAWHQERFELDYSLHNFLEKIEYCWVGGFKGIFNRDKIVKEQRVQFKEKFLGILGQNIPSRSQRNPSNTIIELDNFIIDLFLGLGDPSTLVSTELLEDLIYFVLDILLFHGEENAYDEIDIDNIYVEVEALIKEHLMINSAPSKFGHTVLITGKECQSIPWESLPSLRNSSTTRMPSLKMLINLLEKNERMVINKRNGSFILNPSGDLSKTEERFAEQTEYLTGSLNWKGIKGIKPSEDQFKDFVQDSNLFAYIGHGGGEQFIKTTTLKSMDKAAPALLLGCSSASLQDNNLLEPYGTVYSYLVGGCPMVLGNLWDVTDKDIDKFSLSLFEKWGLGISDDTNENKQMTISDAVRESRDECKLKFLNGAAPIVYGLPLTLL